MIRNRNALMWHLRNDDAKLHQSTVGRYVGAKKDGKAPMAPSQTLPSNLSVAPQHEQVT